MEKNVLLRPLREDDAPFFAYWYNRPEIMFQCGFTEPTTLEKEREVIARREPDAEWFAVTDRNGRLLGETGLLRCGRFGTVPTFRLFFPLRRAREKGFGTEAAKLMLARAFTVYDMNRVAIGVVGENTRALAFYEWLGFWREGLQQQGYYWNGKYSDFVMRRLLRAEWRARTAAQEDADADTI